MRHQQTILILTNFLVVAFLITSSFYFTKNILANAAYYANGVSEKNEFFYLEKCPIDYMLNSLEKSELYLINDDLEYMDSLSLGVQIFSAFALSGLLTNKEVLKMGIY